MHPNVRSNGTVANVGRRRFWLAWVLLALACVPWWLTTRDQADDAGMLAHLHSLFLDVDVLYDNEYRALHMSPTFAFVTKQGLVSNHWPVAATFVQAPGYLLGCMASWMLARLGEGTGSTLGGATILGVRAWAVLVLGWMAWSVFAWAKPSMGRMGAMLVVVAMVCGTPLGYYAFESPLRPHVWGAAATLCVVRAWVNDGVPHDARSLWLLAAWCGLATAIRPQLAVLVVLVVHAFVWHARAQPQPWKAHARTVAGGTLAFLMWPLVTLRLQVFLYGDGLGAFAKPATHHVAAFLFSPYHGALSWAPVLGLAGLMLVTQAWRRQRGAWLVLCIMATQVWLNASARSIEPFSVLGTRTWGGGLSFGPRKLVDSLPLLLPFVLEGAQRASFGQRRMLWVLACLCTAWTSWLWLTSFVDPRLVSDVLPWSALVERLYTPFFGEAWRATLEGRALSWTASGVLAIFVVIPLSGLMVACMRMQASTHAVLPVVLTSGVAAHLWLGIAFARTDLERAAHPERMQRAAQVFHPAHLRLVAEIPAYERRTAATLDGNGSGQHRQ